MGTHEYKFTHLENNMRYIGRTTTTETGVVCDFTASGFEFCAYMEGAVDLTFKTSSYERIPVVWVYNFMSDGRYTWISSAISELGGESAGLYMFRAQRNNAGGVSHPDAAAHATNAEDLADYITEKKFTTRSSLEWSYSSINCFVFDVLDI